MFFMCNVGFSQTHFTYYLGVNGKVLEGNNNHTKIEVDYKSDSKVKVSTYRFDNEKWKIVEEEKIKLVVANTYAVKIKDENGTREIVRTYCEPGDGVINFEERFNNHVIRRGVASSKFPLLFDGIVTEYYPMGQVKNESFYEKNELVSNNNWSKDGIEYFSNIFRSVDVYPGFTSGEKKLHNHILKELKRNQVDFTQLNGRLEVGFVVFEDGQTGGYRVLESINPEVEAIVVNAIRTAEGEWSPAMLNNKKVRYFQTFPINFIHDEFQIEFFDVYSGIAQIERK